MMPSLVLMYQHKSGLPTLVALHPNQEIYPENLFPVQHSLRLKKFNLSMLG